MAKDVITRFKLETTGFDSKIKQAAKDLSAYSKTATQAKEGFNQFTKSNIDAAKALGTIATSTTNAKDRAKELVGAFNDAAKAYNSLTKEQQQSDWAKALAGSLTQLQQRIKETKQEMQELGDSMKGGGIFSGLGSKMEGALAVFGGNLMTKAAGAVAQLGSEMADMVKQGVEMAKAGEGVRIAFERLGRGDILNGLREATHGTVTDLELMKAAVKFNDFKLPLDELGTMLAFAQQKAKDTGQSVDYMVDSIVTGLGRKSLMILDNLGLSATEVRERMKETGDMTKAVGAIIRDQMKNAGDYVETAADRAAQANVTLQNKMEELGRKFGPVEEASNQLWTSMKIGILDIIGGPLATLLNSLTEAGRLKNALNGLNGEEGSGNTKVSQQLKKLQAIKKAGGSDYIFNSTLSGMKEDYNREIAWREQYAKDIQAWQSGKRSDVLSARIKEGQKRSGSDFLDAERVTTEANAYKVMLSQLMSGAKDITNPRTAPTTPVVPTFKPIKEEKDDFVEVNGLINMATERVNDLQKRIREAPTENMITELRDQLKDAQAELDRLLGKEVKIQPAEMVTGLSGFNEQTISAWTAMMKSDLQKADLGSALYSSLTNNMEDMSRLTQTVQSAIKLGLDVPQDTVQQIFERIFDGENMPADMYDSMIQKFIEDFKDRTGKDLVVGENGGLSEGTTQQRKDERDGNRFLKKDDEGKYEAKMTDIMSGMAGGISSVVSGLNTLGVEIPAGLQSVLGGMQAISSILSGIAVTVMAIEAISGADAIIPFAHGGIVPRFANGGLIGRAAAGLMIPGNSMSGDLLRLPVDGGRGMIGVNSGELILNKAQQGNLASQLEGGGIDNLQLDTVIGAEDIRVVLNNRGRRTGRGEYVQSRKYNG